MKRLLVLYGLVLLFSNPFFAQITFRIENITISNVIEKAHVVYYGDSVVGIVNYSGYGMGPKIIVKSVVENNSNDTLFLDLTYKNCFLSMSFRYDNKTYTQEICETLFTYFKIPYEEKTTLPKIILPNSIGYIEFSTLYLVGTDLLEGNYYGKDVDCTKAVVATLPTIRLFYKDDKIDISTNGIENVTIGEFEYMMEDGEDVEEED